MISLTLGSSHMTQWTLWNKTPLTQLPIQVILATVMVKHNEEEKETTKCGAPTQHKVRCLWKAVTEMTAFMVDMASSATANKFLAKEERTS